jgi:hypothetical protein
VRDPGGRGGHDALDGIYVLRTSADNLDPPGVVFACKNLSSVERDFRIIKVDDLDLRPIYHRPQERVTAHVPICMLACYLVWHLRTAWAGPHPGQPPWVRWRPRSARPSWGWSRPH